MSRVPVYRPSCCDPSHSYNNPTPQTILTCPLVSEASIATMTGACSSHRPTCAPHKCEAVEACSVDWEKDAAQAI